MCANRMFLLLVIYIKIENTHSFYILSYETKKETKKIREITNGCLSMLGTVLCLSSLLYA